MSSSNINSAIVYIGTYTPEAPAGADVNGIFIYRLDPASGALESLGAVAGLTNPSYLAADPQKRHLYAVQELETYAGQPGGAVSALAIDPQTSMLQPINTRPTHGLHPCYVSIDQSGRWVMAANYSSGSLCVLPIEADGALGPATATIQHSGSSVNQERQEGPHAHSIMVDPRNRFVLAADLGLDQILIYELDARRGTLTEHHQANLRPGAGPRHLTFHPSGKYLYCMNELDSTVTVFAYDAEQGTLRDLQSVSTLPNGFTGSNTGADIHVHPTGRYLYSSNRGHDSIAIFALDEAIGLLEPIGHVATGGRTPRNFAIDPTGTLLFAANQASDSVLSFQIDEASGGLTPTGHVTEVPKPVCVRIVAGVGS
ncbi:MAG TPA: lactonase family protein [Roseiflexaceae bacterium]|nr:lactonase family protein [Roseiflexaceae bacterium]